MSNKIEFDLGNPVSGWLPVYFKSCDFTLEFTSSKIPENPTSKLCEALILIASDIESEMYWIEESICCFFKFELKDNTYSFKILETDKNGYSQTEIFTVIGEFEDLILPIFRGLKKWTTIEYAFSDWEKIEQSKLDKLDKLIKRRKQKGLCD